MGCNAAGAWHRPALAPPRLEEPVAERSNSAGFVLASTRRVVADSNLLSTNATGQVKTLDCSTPLRNYAKMGTKATLMALPLLRARLAA